MVTAELASTASSFLPLNPPVAPQKYFKLFSYSGFVQPWGNSFALINMAFTEIAIITFQKRFTCFTHLISYAGVALQGNLEPAFPRNPAQSSQDKMQSNSHPAIRRLQPHPQEFRLTAVLDICTY